jgi:hypothetical protein
MIKDKQMTKAGRREFFRRILTVSILITGLSQFGYGHTILALALIVGSVLIYTYIPAVPIPAKALVYDAGMSQTGPDWIGFVLSSLAFVAPIWFAINEPHWGTIHPSSVLLWPMALATSSFWIIGALYSSYWIEIKPRKLIISSTFSVHEVPFNTIKRVKSYRRGLPKWLYMLMPLMLMKGQVAGAGSLLLTQKRTGIELILKTGKSVSIADSGFEGEIIQILQALDKHGVKLAATYQKRLKKIAEAQK